MLTGFPNGLKDEVNYGVPAVRTKDTGVALGAACTPEQARGALGGRLAGRLRSRDRAQICRTAQGRNWNQGQTRPSAFPGAPGIPGHLNELLCGNRRELDRKRTFSLEPQA